MVEVVDNLGVVEEHDKSFALIITVVTVLMVGDAVLITGAHSVTSLVMVRLIVDVQPKITIQPKVEIIQIFSLGHHCKHQTDGKSMSVSMRKIISTSPLTKTSKFLQGRIVGLNLISFSCNRLVVYHYRCK